MVSKLFHAAAIVVFASVLYACDSVPSYDERVPMPTGNSELRGQLLWELDGRDIWYNELNESEIEIAYEDTTVVGELFEGMIWEVLPKDRSISPSLEALPLLLEALNAEGVACSSVRVFDLDWLVCNKDDMPLVNETLTRIVTESWEPE